MKSQEIRVRFPPSPTGLLHIGNVRTFVFNWLFAMQNKGKIVLRMEDTDIARSKREYEDSIIEGLKWLGLTWDEFYRQSERAPVHAKYIQQLIDNGKAFYCSHTQEELEEERQMQSEKKELPRHVCSHKYDKEKAKVENSNGVIRLNIDENSTRKISFDDIIRGKVEFEERLLGDVSIAKNTTTPLYHFAVVVDDYEMQISHVIRGEDHIANTPKHILIQEALGFDSPMYAHLPLILAQDKTKLSKRHGAVSLSEYKDQGYLADAMFNYLAVLGFTAPDGKEILSREELIEVFDLAKVHKSGAVFDTKKLDWINGEYIKKMTDDELLNTIGQKYTKILPMVRERIKKVGDLNEFDFFFDRPAVDQDMLTWKKSTPEESKKFLLRVLNALEKCDFLNQENISKELESITQQTGDRGLVYWPFRVALSGRKASPDPVEIAFIIGKDETLARVRAVL